MALATFAVVVLVVAPAGRLITVPVVNVPITPASLASGQPSPSLSRSKWFGIPSVSLLSLQVVGFG